MIKHVLTVSNISKRREYVFSSSSIAMELRSMASKAIAKSNSNVIIESCSEHRSDCRLDVGISWIPPEMVYHGMKIKPGSMYNFPHIRFKFVGN